MLNYGRSISLIEPSATRSNTQSWNRLCLFHTHILRYPSVIIPSNNNAESTNVYINIQTRCLYQHNRALIWMHFQISASVWYEYDWMFIWMIILNHCEYFEECWVCWHESCIVLVQMPGLDIRYFAWNANSWIIVSFTKVIK